MHIQFAELPVFDQERAKAFYIDHLDCRVVADQPISNDGWRWIELGFPGAGTPLHFLRRKDEAPSESPAFVLVDSDIEATVQACHPALRLNCGAAFSLDQDGEEQLVVVQEIERTYRRRIAVGDIIASIREAIAREHEIAAREIVLIGTGTLPKTTSGKIQRRLTRQMFLAGSLAVLQ